MCKNSFKTWVSVKSSVLRRRSSLQIEPRASYWMNGRSNGSGHLVKSICLFGHTAIKERKTECIEYSRYIDSRSASIGKRGGPMGMYSFKHYDICKAAYFRPPQRSTWRAARVSGPPWRAAA